jgi:hypothetical protein
VIVSGDGDFQPLVNYIQSRGRMAEVMAFDKTTSGKLIGMVHDFTDLGENQRRYLIGPKLAPRVEKKSPTEHESPTESAEEEVDTSDSFFMKLDDAVTDQEESRTRRLEF